MLGGVRYPPDQRVDSDAAQPVTGTSNRMLQRQLRMPFAPHFSRDSQRCYKAFTRRLPHVGFRGAHVLRGGALAQQRGVIRLAITLAQFLFGGVNLLDRHESFSLFVFFRLSRSAGKNFAIVIESVEFTKISQVGHTDGTHDKQRRCTAQAIGSI